MKKPFIIHPYLFAIFPVLFLFTHNIQELEFSDMLVPAAVILAVTIVLLLLMNLFLKDKVKSGIIVSIFLILFFSYEAVYKVINHEITGFIFGRHRYLLTVYALVIFFCFIIKSREKLQKFSRFLTISSICLISISIANISLYYLRNPIHITERNQPDICKSTDTSLYPHIFYITLDSYARADILKEIYGYDNTDFTDYLKSKGFYLVDKATTNYIGTYVSLTSSLNLEYIEKLNPKERQYKLRHNLVNEFLKKRGYKSIVFDNHIFGVKVHKGKRFPGEKIMLPSFQRELIQTTPFKKFYSKIDVEVIKNYRKNILAVFKHLPDFAKSKDPVFVFVHMELPHTPFIFNINGDSVYLNEWRCDIASNKEQINLEQYYRDYSAEVIFLNKKVKEAIDNIFLQSTRRLIIILQADHGPAPAFKKSCTATEMCSILNAYYFYDKNYSQLTPDITPVNTFRLIFNQYFGTNYNFLKSKNFILNPKDEKTLVDITDRISKTK